ncbi:MAG: hypothetical protein JWN32_3950 [Solirubrobacterales bacterium]|nr:hypothetical protein [Solirubrobacterales bacterium]
MTDHDAYSDHDAEELLRRALLDGSDAAAVALTVSGLPLSEAVTVIFHGRRDLGTVQTYVAHGARGAGSAVGGSELLRVPCDLDLADAYDRDEAERLYAEQAAALRDALLSADTVLEIWREPLVNATGGEVTIDRSIALRVNVPAHRLLPVALVAPESRLFVTPVCSARTLAEGRPPMGIACAQQDVARIYPLPDDPERCLEDFLALAADHARALADQLAHQEASVERFLELTGDDFSATG